MFRVVVDDDMRYVWAYGIKDKATAKEVKSDLLDKYGFNPKQVSVEWYNQSQFRTAYENRFTIETGTGYLLFNALSYSELNGAISLILERLAYKVDSLKIRRTGKVRVEIHYDCDGLKQTDLKDDVKVVASNGDCLDFSSLKDAKVWAKTNNLHIVQSVGRYNGEGLKSKTISNTGFSSEGHAYNKDSKWYRDQSDFVPVEFRSDRKSEKYCETMTVLNPYLRYTGASSVLPKEKRKKESGLSEVAMSIMRRSDDVNLRLGKNKVLKRKRYSLTDGQIYDQAVKLLRDNPLIGFTEMKTHFKKRSSLSDRRIKKILQRVY